MSATTDNSLFLRNEMNTETVKKYSYLFDDIDYSSEKSIRTGGKSFKQPIQKVSECDLSKSIRKGTQESFLKENVIKKTKSKFNNH